MLTLVSELDTLFSDVETLVSEDDRLTTEVLTLVSELETLSREPETLVSDDDTLSREPLTLVSELETLSREPETLVSDDDTLSREPLTLVSELETLSREPETLVSDDDTLSREPLTLVSELETLSREPQTLVSELGDAVEGTAHAGEGAGDAHQRGREGAEVAVDADCAGAADSRPSRRLPTGSPRSCTTALRLSCVVTRSAAKPSVSADAPASNAERTTDFFVFGSMSAIPSQRRPIPHGRPSPTSRSCPRRVGHSANSPDGCRLQP